MLHYALVFDFVFNKMNTIILLRRDRLRIALFLKAATRMPLLTFFSLLLFILITGVSSNKTAIDYIDYSVDPCQDFYEFTCQKWMKENPTFGGLKRIQHTSFMKRDVQKRLYDLLRQPPNPKTDNEATLKAKLLYATCVDKDAASNLDFFKDTIEALGGWPLEINGFSANYMTLENFLATAAAKFESSPLFKSVVSPNVFDSTRNVLALYLPSEAIDKPKFYSDAKYAYQRELYYNFMMKAMVIFGAAPYVAYKRMKPLRRFEARLSKIVHASSVAHEKLPTNYTMRNVAYIQRIVPSFNWTQYFSHFLSTSVAENDIVVITNIPYFKQLEQLLSESRPEDIRDYTIWKIVLRAARDLTGELREAYREYKRNSNVIKPDERARDCVKIVEKAMPLAVASMYIANHFDTSAKNQISEMIKNLFKAFKQLLKKNQWMDKRNKASAIEKLNAISTFVAYPDSVANSSWLIKNYEKLIIRPHSFLENLFEVKKFMMKKLIKRYRKLNNRTHWNPSILLTDINAYYTPAANSITFPVVFFQRPHFDSQSPQSLNYGAVGMVIGHEITHGFDDSGSLHDKFGNLRQWWDRKTMKEFRKRLRCFIDQYSSHVEEISGKRVDGIRTLGENIADNGGLKQAYKAYQLWVRKHGEEKPVKGTKLNHNQLFFVSFGFNFCQSQSKRGAREHVAKIAHSPYKTRVIETLKNLKEFSRAFNCAPGTPMNPKKKCFLW